MNKSVRPRNRKRYRVVITLQRVGSIPTQDPCRFAPGMLRFRCLASGGRAERPLDTRLPPVGSYRPTGRNQVVGHVVFDGIVSSTASVALEIAPLADGRPASRRHVLHRQRFTGDPRKWAGLHGPGKVAKGASKSAAKSKPAPRWTVWYRVAVEPMDVAGLTEPERDKPSRPEKPLSYQEPFNRRFLDERRDVSGRFDPQMWLKAREHTDRMRRAVRVEPDPPGGAPKDEIRAACTDRDGKPLKVVPSKHPRPNSVFGDPNRVVEVVGPIGTGDATLRIGVSRDELAGIDPATLRLFRWDERRRSFSLVPRSRLSGDGGFVWGRVNSPGVYAAFGLPSDRARRESAALACRVKPWVSLDGAGSRHLADRICQVILCNDAVAPVLDDPRALDAAGLGDHLGRDLATYGKPPLNAKGEPIGKPPQVGAGVERVRGRNVCDQCLGVADTILTDPNPVECQLLDPDIPDFPGPGISSESAPAGCREGWVSIGPSNRSGRVQSIAFNPLNPRIVYAGDGQGGVFKSFDGGATWRPMTNAEPELSIGAVAVDPSHPDTVYAGTGEFADAGTGGSGNGIGILRSENGGETWDVRPSNNVRYSRIVVHPTHANVVYAAGPQCLERSIDGGQSWTPILAKNVSDFLLDPTNPNVLYAGVADADGVVSTDRAETIAPGEAGAWSVVKDGLRLGADQPGPFNFVKLAATVDQAGRTVLWCQTLAEFRDDSTPIAVFRWNRATSRWDERRANEDNSQGGYCSVIGVEPGTPSVVYSLATGARWTLDGTTWERCGGSHVDHHAIAFDPSNPRRILVGTDGGIYAHVRRRPEASEDDPFFTPASAGVDTVELLNIAVSSVGKLGVGGATQDQGILYVDRDDSTVWTGLPGNEWGPFEVAAHDGHVVMWNPRDGGFHRTEDGGMTSRGVRNGLPGCKAERIAFHPEHPEHVLVSTENCRSPAGVIRLPASVILNVGDFTFAAWLKPSRQSFTVVSGARVEDDNAWLLRHDDNGWHTSIHGGSGHDYPGADPADGGWHHVAWTRRSDQESLFVDGDLVGQSSVSDRPLWIDEGGLVLGQEQDIVGGGFDGGQSFVGLMDEVRMYGMALTRDQVRTLMVDPAPAYPLLHAHYPLETGADDVSQHARHGTVERVTFVAGKVGRGAEFRESVDVASAVFLTRDGGADPPAAGFHCVLGNVLARVPSEVAHGLGDFTVSLWIRPSKPGAYTLLSGANAATGDAWTLMNDDAERWTTFINGLSQDYGTRNLSDGGWHHVVWRRSGSRESLYIDGTWLGAKTVSAQALALSETSLALGRRALDVTGAHAFAGDVEDLRIYDVGLSDVKVDELHHDTLGDVQALRAHYTLDGSTRDRRVNGLHLVIEGFTLFVPGRSGQALRLESRLTEPSDIAFASFSPDVVYLVTNGGQVWASADAGASWELVGDGPVPGQRIASVTVDWQDTERLYVTYRLAGIPHVHTSPDGGRSWEPITGSGDPDTSVPDVPAHRVAVHAGASATLYVVTDVGVFRTLDGGQHWDPFDQGLPSVVITDMAYRVQPPRLYVSTYGRGAYCRRL